MTLGAVEPAMAALDEVQPVAVPATSLLAADTDLASVFSGKGIPTAIMLKDLTPEWRAMTTNGQFEIGNFQTFVGTFAGGGFATSYYTQGKTVTIGSETYIVAYSLLSLADKVTPELPLNLSLLNLKTIGSMSNIRTFDVAKETKILEKQLAALQLGNVFDPTVKPEEKPADVEPPVTPPVVKPTPKKPAVRRRTRTIRRRSR